MSSNNPVSSDLHSTVPLTPQFVVGIGASAGGLEALEKFFRATPDNLDIAFVVVQHLSPDFKSLMDELLERFTNMKVVAVNEPTTCEKNVIYLLPPKKEVVIEGNVLIPYDRPNDGALNLPINVFFKSLAKSWGKRGIAVILSGTGSDGTIGAASVHDADGVVVAQLPESCRFEGMPQSAINAGVVDAVLRPEEIPSLLAAAINEPNGFGAGQPLIEKEENSNQLSMVLDVLKSEFKTDFEHYKPSTILRRIQRRISLKGDTLDLDKYAKVLLNNKAELTSLYHDLLIGVTSFFRDQEAFKALQQTVLPEIFDQLQPDEEIRIWICGCSTGEEAYSIAMMLHEEISIRQISNPLKIFATDLHPGSLQTAAEGLYESSKLEGIPDSLRLKYFHEFDRDVYKVNPVLRKSIIFCEHNVLKNPPFTKMHMVICRNLLIYFKVAAQVAALVSFNFALNHGGILFLGASETPGSLGNDFGVLDRNWKIYKKLRESHLRDALRTSNIAGKLTSHEIGRATRDKGQALNRLYNNLLDRYIPAGLLLSEDFELLHVFGDAHRFMSPPVGRVTGDVFPLLNGGLAIAVSTGLNSAKERPGKMVYKGVKVEKFEGMIEVTIESIYEKISQRNYFMVVISEESHPLPVLNGSLTESSSYSLSEETEQYVQQLQAELTRTKEALQTNAEELETSNEELQASNEELLASNEEFQSTNEELHSVNEELYTVNSEHEHKILELDRISSDLRNLINSTEDSIILLDTQFQIRTFTPRISEIFSLVYQDLGRDIRHFMPKISDPDLFKDLALTMTTQASVEKIVKVENHPFKYLLRQSKPFSSNTEGESGMLLSYKDVSEREILRIINEGYKKAFELRLSQFLILDFQYSVLELHSNSGEIDVFRGIDKGQDIHHLVQSHTIKNAVKHELLVGNSRYDLMPFSGQSTLGWLAFPQTS